MYLVKVKFEWLACSTEPAPAVLRTGEVGWLKPWLQDMISISLACSAAVLPPSMPSELDVDVACHRLIPF